MAGVPDAAAILFDALGTLLRLHPPGPRLRDALRRRFGLTVSVAQAECALAAEISHYRSNLLRGRDGASLAALRAECAGVLWEALPQAPRCPPQARVQVLLDCLRFEAYADAAPALRRVRTAGRRAVVVSNWDVSLHEVLERTGLAHLLDGVVTSAEVGVSKPAPEPFLAALRLAGVAAQEAVHVGDSLREDLEGARAAGLRAVLIQRDGPAVLPQVPPPIASLDELDGLLAW